MIAPGQVLGRQPNPLHIAPSKSYPWYGFVTEGQRFTREQVAALISMGRDPLTAEAVTVKRQASFSTEMYFPADLPRPEYHFECPIIGRRADGRLKVIAPSGDAKLVFADGWVRRPRKPMRIF